MALSQEDREFFAELLVPKERRILGFRIPELAIVVSLVLGTLTFYVRTDEAMKRLIVSTEWVLTFAKNSDSYHSAVSGVQFEQGKPINPGFDPRPFRKVLNGTEVDNKREE